MRKVVLSKKASKKLGLLLEYLESEWSLKVKNDFLTKFDKSLTQIQNFPESGSKTDFVKGLRMLIITKQTSLLYKYDSTTIKIAAIFDNRMNPTKIKEEIK